MQCGTGGGSSPGGCFLLPRLGGPEVPSQSPTLLGCSYGPLHRFLPLPGPVFSSAESVGWVPVLASNDVSRGKVLYK